MATEQRNEGIVGSLVVAMKLTNKAEADLQVIEEGGRLNGRLLGFAIQGHW